MQIDAASFAEFEISEFEISRFVCSWSLINFKGLQPNLGIWLFAIQIKFLLNSGQKIHTFPSGWEMKFDWEIEFLRIRIHTRFLSKHFWKINLLAVCWIERKCYIRRQKTSKGFFYCLPIIILGKNEVLRINTTLSL